MKDPLKQGLKHDSGALVKKKPGFQFVEVKDPLKQELSTLQKVINKKSNSVEVKDPLKQGLKPTDKQY